MKGIIFNLVEEAVTAEHGVAVWDTILSAAGVDGAFTALGSYPDHEFTALIAAGSSALGVTPDELAHRLGHDALLGLAVRYPRFFEPYASARPFLLTLNDVIHPEVRKLHADATPPEFWFEDGGAALVVHYQSSRMLCALARGMISGAATHYGERAALEQSSCMLDGAPHCTFTCEFAAA